MIYCSTRVCWTHNTWILCSISCCYNHVSQCNCSWVIHNQALWQKKMQTKHSNLLKYEYFSSATPSVFLRQKHPVVNVSIIPCDVSSQEEGIGGLGEKDRGWTTIREAERERKGERRLPLLLPCRKKVLDSSQRAHLYHTLKSPWKNGQVTLCDQVKWGYDAPRSGSYFSKSR